MRDEIKRKVQTFVRTDFNLKMLVARVHRIVKRVHRSTHPRMRHTPPQTILSKSCWPGGCDLLRSRDPRIFIEQRSPLGEKKRDIVTTRPTSRGQRGSPENIREMRNLLVAIEWLRLSTPRIQNLSFSSSVWPAGRIFGWPAGSKAVGDTNNSRTKETHALFFSKEGRFSLKSEPMNLKTTVNRRGCYSDVIFGSQLRKR